MKIELFTPTAKNEKSLDELQQGDELWITIDDGKLQKLKVSNWNKYKGKLYLIEAK